MSHIFAFMTATAIKFEEDEDYAEEYGWVSGYGDTDILDSRNYATPIVTCPEDWHETYGGALSEDEAETVKDYVYDALEALGEYTDRGNGTFDATKPFVDPATGTVYTYALHFLRKELNPRSVNIHDMYREVPWHPATDGGIEV